MKNNTLILTKHHIACGSFLLLSFILYGKASIGTPFCSGDCGGYIELMGNNILSLGYWNHLVHMYRSMSIPIFFSLFGNHTLYHEIDIMYAQTWISFFSWLIFAWALSGLIAHATLRSMAFAMFTLMMFGRRYMHLNQYLLSDAFSLSLILLWYAAVIQSYALCQWLSMRSSFFRAMGYMGLILLTVLTVFARDSNILLMLLALPFLCRKLYTRFSSVTIITLLLLAELFYCWHGSSYYRRAIAISDIILGNILPYPDRVAFFAEHGMVFEPSVLSDPQVIQRWDFMRLNTREYYTAANKLRKGLFPAAAQRIYMQYSLSHPHVMLERILDYYPLMLNPVFLPEVDGDKPAEMRYGVSVFPFIPQEPGYLSVIDDIPLLPLLSVATLAFAMYGWLLAKRRVCPDILFAGALLFIAGLIGAIAGFNGEFAELNEMMRHAYIGSIFFKSGSIALIIGTTEWWLSNRKHKGAD